MRETWRTTLSWASRCGKRFLVWCCDLLAKPRKITVTRGQETPVGRHWAQIVINATSLFVIQSASCATRAHAQSGKSERQPFCREMFTGAWKIWRFYQTVQLSHLAGGLVFHTSRWVRFDKQKQTRRPKQLRRVRKKSCNSTPSLPHPSSSRFV